MIRRLITCASSLFLLVALSGCGDDDDTPAGGADPTVTTEAPDGGGSAGGDVDPGDPRDGTGTGDPAPDDAVYVDTLVERIVGGSDLADDEARCLATAYVDAAGGAEALSAAGMDPESWFETSASFDEQGLPSDDATVDRLAEDLGGCSDGYDLLFRTVAPDAGDDVRSCVTSAVSEAEVRHQLALSSVRGGDASAERDVDIFRVLRQCQDETLPG